MDLSAVVASEIADWPHGCPLARALVGSDEPPAIAAAFDAWCRRHLGAGVVDGHRFAVSVGLVTDVTLDDCRRLVVKAVRPDWVEHLEVSVRVRAALGRGYPCPAPVAGPLAFGPGAAVADEYLAAGVPGGRTALAAGYAELIDRLAAVDHADLGHLMAPADGDEIWPAPHDLRFDFEATAAGAAWIDDIARRARARLRDAGGKLVVAHNDWRAEHVHVGRTDGSTIVATYDWDSVAAAPEAWFVGHMAALHTCDWSTEPVAPLPSPAEVDAFVDDYEAAAGRSLDRAAVAAAGALALAYGVRCVHSDAVLLGWPDRADMTGALRAWVAHAEI